tara:strand:- start:8109 stop:8879 length:771 start_codon:yes stop_codon:yes gene_type:complete
MVMNTAQENISEATQSAAIHALNTAKSALELTRNENFLNGTFDIFDVLAQNTQERKALEKSLNSTIALLKRSAHALQEAEKTIEVQNHKLEAFAKISSHDEKSGLLNRRGFMNVLKKEVSRMNRTNSVGGLIVVFNLENLKLIRKRHGEAAADMAVQILANAFQQEIREMDHAGRMLDDEFVLLLTDTDMGQALSRLQAMAMRLNKLSMIWGKKEINLNLSLGLKNFSAQEDAIKIFEAANEDLKRNRSGAQYKSA